MIQRLLLIFMPIILIALQGCASNHHSIDERRHLAERLAQEAGMTSQIMHTSRFNLQSYVRIKDPVDAIHRQAVVYIEGDGHAWDGRVPSTNPTPTNPLALRLAIADNSGSVVYLARPCQYVEDICNVKYWTSHRMAPEVIAAYTQTLKSLQQNYRITEFRLVGFSGGGGVAALIAAQLRQQNKSVVADLRTVAGNIDHVYWTRSQNLAPLTGSLNPADFAAELSGLPQIHFIGKEDLVISDKIYQSYREQMQNKSCTQGLVEPASHVRGWESLWKDLQNIQPSCQNLQHDL